MSIKERTQTWIPGFQIHAEPQQQQTKGAGLASALNQGQMQQRADGWLRGEAGNGVLAAGQTAPQPCYTQKKAPHAIWGEEGVSIFSTSINYSGVALPKQHHV